MKRPNPMSIEQDGTTVLTLDGKRYEFKPSRPEDRGPTATEIEHRPRRLAPFRCQLCGKEWGLTDPRLAKDVICRDCGPEYVERPFRR